MNGGISDMNDSPANESRLVGKPFDPPTWKTDNVEYS